jgi:hypothetical protein
MGKRQGSCEHVAIGNRRARHMQLRGWMGSLARDPVAHVTPVPASSRELRAPMILSRALVRFGAATPVNPRSRQPAARPSPPTLRRRGFVQAAAVASRHAARVQAQCSPSLSVSLDAAEDESNHGGRGPAAAQRGAGGLAARSGERGGPRSHGPCHGMLRGRNVACRPLAPILGWVACSALPRLLAMDIFFKPCMSTTTLFKREEEVSSSYGRHIT